MHRIYSAESSALRPSAQFSGLVVKTLSAWFLLFVTQALTAETFSPKAIDLSTALELTSKHNPSLKLYQFKQTALDGAAYSANLKPGYELESEFENFAGSSPFSGLGQSEITVSLSSIIELGGKRSARVDTVNAQSQLVEAQQKNQSLEIIAQLTRTFIAALADQERSILAAETVNLAANTYATVKQKAAAGAISQAEVKRAFAALKQAQLNQQSVIELLNIHRLKLSLFWAEKEPHFKTFSGDLYAFGQFRSLDTVLNAVNQSSMLQVLVTEQQLAESKLRLAKTQSQNDIKWFVGVRRLEDSNDTAMTTGISVPLFSTKRNRGVVIAAQANIDHSIMKQQEAQLNFYGQLNEIYTLRSLATQRFKVLHDEIIPALSSALKSIQKAYSEGRYSYLEYQTANQELIVAKHELINTAERILVYGIEIEQLTAEPFYTHSQTHTETKQTDKTKPNTPTNTTETKKVNS